MLSKMSLYAYALRLPLVIRFAHTGYVLKCSNARNDMKSMLHNVNDSNYHTTTSE